ncbi:MAG: outer membrane beta-barrel domain-containing protein [Pseudomonadota bacterium]
MEYWFQRLLLIVCCALQSPSLWADEQLSNSQDNKVSTLDIDSEYFDAGIYVGTINIDDFTSEILIGTNATFKATEDFFLQFNYLRADTTLSSFERSQGRLFEGSDRVFNHFDLLLGANLLQGEFFFLGNSAKLASLYIVAGVGDTDFGDESSFTYTIGSGFQIALTRSLLLRIDYRDHIYKSNLISEDEITHNIQLSAGLSILF